MPTYDYKCSNCGHLFEEVQSMKDAALTQCPKCGKDTLARLIGGGGIIFKGSGFYQTDYKNTKTSTPASPVKKADPKPATDTPATSTPEKKD